MEKNFEKKILFFLESRIVERENRNREDGIKGGWIKMFHLGNSIRKRFWIYRGVHIMTSFYLSENRPLKPSRSNYWQEFRWVRFFGILSVFKIFRKQSYYTKVLFMVTGARTALFPLQVIKTRLQYQNQEWSLSN